MQEEQAAAAPAAGATVNDSAPQNAEADEGQRIELPEGAEDDLVEQIESAIVTPNEPMDLVSTKEALQHSAQTLKLSCGMLTLPLRPPA